MTATFCLEPHRPDLPSVCSASKARYAGAALDYVEPHRTASWLQPLVADRLCWGWPGIVFVNVVLRYTTGDSIVWAEEVARHLMIWVTFLGAGLVLRFGGHVAIDALHQASTRCRCCATWWCWVGIGIFAR